MSHRDGFPRLSGCVARGFRCPASLRHALLAERLGKPSLWVITKDHWYYFDRVPAVGTRRWLNLPESRPKVAARSRPIGGMTLNPQVAEPAGSG